jgi:hypothetical protein
MSPATSCPPTIPRAPEPPAADNVGRATNGRFARGNAGGPGNPFARQVAELRRAALAAATPETIADVLRQLEKQALQGDVAAARLYLSYTLGKPAPAVDPDTLDVQEAVQMQQEVALIQAVTHAVVKPLLSALLAVVRVTRPEANQKFIAELLAGLHAQEEADLAEETSPSACPGADSTCQDETTAPSPNGANGGEPDRPAGCGQRPTAPLGGRSAGAAPAAPATGRISWPRRPEIAALFENTTSPKNIVDGPSSAPQERDTGHLPGS